VHSVRDSPVDPQLLRLNILASALGSTAYVVGSVGFIPVVASMPGGPDVGNWGFIVGSWFIGVSQICKVVRIWRDADIDSRTDRCTSIGVEGGAGIGAWCFFVGTIMFAFFPDAVSAALVIWLVGSLAFLCGGLFLTGRHLSGK
jgi:hypothetical protein